MLAILPEVEKREMVCLTIKQEMREEAVSMRAVRMAREGVKNLPEGPDADIDRIIRAIRQNGGAKVGKLKKEFPALADEGLAGKIADVIASAFGDDGSSSLSG